MGNRGLNDYRVRANFHGGAGGRASGPKSRPQCNGLHEIFREQVSSVGERQQLKAALDFVREADTLCVTKLDRLARSTTHLLSLVEQLEK